MANRILSLKLAVLTMPSFGGNSTLTTLSSCKSKIFFPKLAYCDRMLGLKQLKSVKGKVFGEEELKSLLPKGKKTCTVSVEGNIGCGKSTLLEYFKDSPNVQSIKEPIEQWTNIQGHNALSGTKLDKSGLKWVTLRALLYQDPNRWSFTFNLYAQLTRVQMHQCPHKKPVKLLERSLYSTHYCFVENSMKNNTINGLEYAILNKWFEFLTRQERTDLDLIVYLRADPEVCYERIKKRSRKEEICVPFDLIQRLHDLHEDWLVHQQDYQPPCPVMVLDANKEYTHMTKLYEDRRQDILCGYI